MRHGRAVPWEEVAEPVVVRFCRPDWRAIVRCVREEGRNPLAQCNAAYAEYERGAPTEIDRDDLEASMYERSRQVLARAERGVEVSARRLVGARIVTWSLEALASSNA